jgi:WD40 repeat protein
MALSPTEDMICAATTDNQLLCMPADNLNSIQSEHVKYMICSFHGPKPIVGLDTCYRKPLFATCSKDNAVKIWNFQRMELELNKTFPEETNCVALHPAGLHIAIGFSDKLRIYHILVDDLKLCHEIAIKNCRECKFSDGGNFLGVANGNTINIFSFFSGEKVIDLRGHNSKIRSLQWIENGNQLLSCGQDGAVYLWDVEEGKRAGELVRKGILYTSAVSSGDTAFVVGNDRILREMDMPELNVAKEYEAGALLGHLAITGSRNALFASTADPGKLGVIRLYPFPVSGEYTEIPCMATPITRMMLTRDQNYLVVTDEAGCVSIFDLYDRFKNNSSTVAASGALLDTPQGDWTDEVLVSRVDLEDKAQLVIELRSKVDELKLHNEYKLKLKEMSYSEKIKEVTDKFVHELEQAKHKLSLLQEERTDAEIEHSKRIKQLEEKHQHDLQETETEFQTQIMEEVGKYQKLVRLRDAQGERLAEQRRVLIRTQELYLQELKSDFETKLLEERQLRSQLEEELAELEKSLKETQTQLEDDVDTEVEGLRKNFEERLAAAKEVTLKYKGDNGIMKKKFSVIQKDMEDQKEEIKMLLEKERSLHEQIKVLEKEVSAHKREIKARDGTIGEKEKRIYELKKKNQELDKFKFVLDFKIRELKRQIEPRQQEIQAMKEQIKDMDMELEKYHKLNTTLDQNIGDMRALIDATQHEISSKWSRAKQLEQLIAKFKSQIQLSVSFIQNPMELRSRIEQIYSEHVSDALEMKAVVEPEVEQEYERHRQYLSKSVLALKRQLNEAASGHGRANRDLMEENMNLIAVITQQRESNRDLKIKFQAALGRLQHLARISARRMSKDGGGSSVYDPSNSTSQDDANDDPLLQLERNRDRMTKLRSRIRELEARMMMQKAYSREVLPPMDGVHQEMQQMRLEPLEPSDQEGNLVDSEALGKVGDSFIAIY